MEYLKSIKMPQIAVKCLKIFDNLERRISISLQEGNIVIRPAKRNGLWCGALIPMILLIYTQIDEVGILYKLVAFMSIGMFFYCLLFIIFLSTSSTILKEQSFGGCVPCGLISAMLVYTFLKQDFLCSVVVTFPSVYLLSWLLRMSLVTFQKTFTIGEAMIVTQIITLFSMMPGLKFFFELYSDDKEMEFISVIIYTVLFAVGLIVAVLYVLRDDQRNLKSLTYIVISAAVFVIVTLHILLGYTWLPDIFVYIFIKDERYKIFAFWLALTIIAILILCIRTKLVVKATTVTRKTFHVLASLVFMSGIILDVYLMTLAAGIGLGVLIFVEALRKSKIEPISSALQASFLVYKDEKDCGWFAVTALYLYVGLSFPLAAVPGRRRLELLSGVLATGVGDTAASWAGARYGYYNWPGSNKTFEGTLFNVLSQVLVVYMLKIFALLDDNNALLRTLIAATASGLVEARTSQVDNLVLPLITLLAFQATWLLR